MLFLRTKLNLNLDLQLIGRLKNMNTSLCMCLLIQTLLFPYSNLFFRKIYTLPLQSFIQFAILSRK
jgi:hypothetical protein